MQELFDAFTADALDDRLVGGAAVGQATAQRAFARRMSASLFGEGGDDREALCDGDLQYLREVLLPTT